MTIFKPIITQIFIHSWWVVAFILASCIIYERALREPKALYQQLTIQSVELQKQKQMLLEEKQNLQLQINSQSDVAWVELVLMKGLGLVPEGYEKVYFYSDPQEF